MVLLRDITPLRHSLLLYPLLLFSLVCSSTGYAKEFTIGVEEINYYPYYYTEDNLYKGFAREFLDAFAHKHGYTFSYLPLPIKRLYRTLTKNKIDFKFPDHPSWGKEDKGDYSITYSQGVVEYVDGILVLPENKTLTIDKLTTIIYVLGFTPPVLNKLTKQHSIAVTHVSNWESLFHTTLKGRVEGAFYNTLVAAHLLENKYKNPGGLVLAPNLPNARGNYRLSTINHGDIMHQFNEFLLTKQASKIRSKHKLTVYTSPQ